MSLNEHLKIKSPFYWKSFLLKRATTRVLWKHTVYCLAIVRHIFHCLRINNDLHFLHFTTFSLIFFYLCVVNNEKQIKFGVFPVQTWSLSLVLDQTSNKAATMGAIQPLYLYNIYPKAYKSVSRYSKNWT